MKFHFRWAAAALSAAALSLASAAPAFSNEVRTGIIKSVPRSTEAGQASNCLPSRRGMRSKTFLFLMMPLNSRKLSVGRDEQFAPSAIFILASVFDSRFILVPG